MTKLAYAIRLQIIFNASIASVVILRKEKPVCAGRGGIV
jgi:hypothetical protein